MARLLSRVDLRDLAYTGIAAGLMFIGFAMVATAVLTGSATALMPLRMIGAIVLGSAALDPNYSILVAVITGVAVHLLLSIAFAAIFMEIVIRMERATEGELMATSGRLALTGTVFGTALWLINFYVIAPLAGWTWFPDGESIDAPVLRRRGRVDARSPQGPGSIDGLPVRWPTQGRCPHYWAETSHP
jgi:hypothetical protein